MLQRQRFAHEETEAYRSRRERGAFLLEIKKKNCFAWVKTRKFHSYQDLVLEGVLRFERGNGYTAAGLLVRYINDENFYYVLISNKGYLRFDVLFNRKPLHLIDWTEFNVKSLEPGVGSERQELLRDGLELRLICRGNLFTFFIDDEWVAEVEDDTIPRGSIGFAAQNFDTKGSGRFYLDSLRVDARPVYVERAYYRWVHYFPARRERRLALAHTFHSMGRFPQVVIQIKRALKQGEGSAEEYFLLAESYLQARLYEQALEALEQSLLSAGDKEEAVLEKANVLFLLKRYIPARDYILSIIEHYRDNAHLWNLLGNNEYALGNWKKAVSAYKRAAEVDAEVPLFLTNLARTQERLFLLPEAFRNYLYSTRLLFRREDYDELSLVVPRARDLASRVENIDAGQIRELEAIEGKMLFHEGRTSEAETRFRQLIDQDHQDSAVFFLYGLILLERGQRDLADPYLVKATELKDDFALFWFRLAENRFLLERDAQAALRKAYELDPEDPWINNLCGQVQMKAGSMKEAAGYFEKAVELAPAEADFYGNYSQSLLRDDPERAEAVVTSGLKTAGEQAGLYNQRGNICIVRGNIKAAWEDYEKALRLDPSNVEFMQNCVACCLELDMIMRAEDLLAVLLDQSPTAAVYNLNGNLALLKREYRRAELSYQEALKLEEDNPDVKVNLLSIYLERGQYRESRDLADEILSRAPKHSKGLELQARLRERFEQSLSCVSCGRTWWAPTDIPPQPRLNIRGEPPAEAPAGRCQSCGKIFCIGCAAEHVEDLRLKCPQCSGALKASEDALKYLIFRYL